MLAPLDALKRIQETMNGEEWDADTLDVIAGIMREAGFTIDDVEDPDPDYDDNGNLRAG